MLADASDDTTKTLVPSEVVKERKQADGKHDTEEVSDGSDLICCSEHNLSTLKRVTSLSLCPSLPLSTTAVKAQQRIEEEIRAFTSYINWRLLWKRKMRTLLLHKKLKTKDASSLDRAGRA